MSVSRKDFYAKGYATGIDVLNQKEVADVRRDFQKFEQEIGKENAQYSLHNVHTQHPWVLKLATHTNVLGALKPILGDDIVLLDSRFICKYPCQEMDDGEKYVAWHQDVRYWGIEGDVISVWLAIDDADVENGCMVVIPGSHTNGILNHQSAKTDGNMLTSNQEIPSHLFDTSKSVPCPLKAGQMSLHHGHLVHGSEANNSSRRRCGFVIRYVSTSAKPIIDPDRPRKFESTVLVNGKNNQKNFSDNSPSWFTWRH
ncbi:hypothetical protein LOTGIDRAFT_178435 [Lottia gigantea]|uniref:Fe2OG dioxygenase domain-containing protein n=1 Tax=Lottia gigantea TaxID=225164 RepID=V4BZB5_LOTGI|nr:hypothetical protein LOTGIDRAFT_178435 [Lottia gigantea]ESO94484.1 hypothetical protein LOTGIDRAFT_178435 [Lottia gigantea]